MTWRARSGGPCLGAVGGGLALAEHEGADAVRVAEREQAHLIHHAVAAQLEIDSKV